VHFLESSVIGVRAACHRLSAGAGHLQCACFQCPAFAEAWQDIPLLQRIFLLFVAYGLWVYFTGTRRSIGRRLNTEEVESSRDFMRFEAMPELAKAIATTRDMRLVAEVSAAVAGHTAGTRIGVLYGAAHMRVVSRLLTSKYGYRVVESEWITVFDYQE
jgi:hypothetical protein